MDPFVDDMEADGNESDGLNAYRGPIRSPIHIPEHTHQQEYEPVNNHHTFMPPDDRIFEHPIYQQTNDNSIQAKSSYHVNDHNNMAIEDNMSQHDLYQQTNDINKQKDKEPSHQETCGFTLEDIKKIVQKNLDELEPGEILTKSLLWIAFKKKNNQESKCNINGCGVIVRKYRTNSTGAAWDHLYNQHREIYLYLKSLTNNDHINMVIEVGMSSHGFKQPNMLTHMKGQSSHHGKDYLILDNIKEIVENKLKEAATSGKNPRSFAWIAFKKIKKNGIVTAKCEICGKETTKMIKNSTGPLWEHLYKKHLDIHNYLEPYKVKKN